MLRHKPNTIDIVLDENGWVDIAVLREATMNVGSGRRNSIVLIIKSLAMRNTGFKFCRSDDRVWLADLVP